MQKRGGGKRCVPMFRFSLSTFSLQRSIGKGDSLVHISSMRGITSCGGRGWTGWDCHQGGGWGLVLPIITMLRTGGVKPGGGNSISRTYRDGPKKKKPITFEEGGEIVGDKILLEFGFFLPREKGKMEKI